MLGRGRIAALALAVFACRGERITTPPATVSADADAWSGGDLVVRSNAFVGADSLPTVTAGAASLAVKSFGADSVSVQLPDTNGSLTLTVRLESGAVLSPVTVKVHGYAGTAPGPRVDGYVYPWPRGGVPTALAFQDGRVVRLDYRTNLAEPLTADTGFWSACLKNPLPAATGTGFVTVTPLDSSLHCGRIVAVPVAASGASPDTAPTHSYSWALAAWLGRGNWLISGGVNNTSLYRGTTSPNWSWTFLCSEAAGIEISPRGDRVVPLCGSSDTLYDVPVIDVASATVAYTLAPDIRWLWAAGFTPGGDTLFAIGTISNTEAALLGLDAATGRELARVPRAGPPDFSAALIADPTGPWLYVLGWADSLVPYVDVFDRATMTKVAALRVPSWATDSVPHRVFLGRVYPGDWALLVDPFARRLYATVNNDPAYPPQPARSTTVLRFDLMP